MKRFNRKLAIVLVIVLAVLPLAACGKQTTLDRVGGVLLTAVDGYQLQLDQLKSQGVIDAEKYDRLTRKNGAIRAQVAELARVISGFGVIGAGDVPKILQQIDLVAGVVESSLSDPAWTSANANLGALRALRWIRATLSTTAVVVAGLFPPKPPGVTPASAKPAPPREARKVKIDLPNL